MSVALCVRFKAVSTQAEDALEEVHKNMKTSQRGRDAHLQVSPMWQAKQSAGTHLQKLIGLHMRGRVMPDSRQNRRAVDAGSALARGGAAGTFSCIRFALLFSGLGCMAASNVRL